MNPRVLVVDDDEHLLRALSMCLARAGFVVTTAGDGTPAMALSETQRFERVVVDFNMVTTTGAEVVRHYKQLFGDQIFCLVLSGEDDDAVRAACFEAGADDVYLKPASPTALRKRLGEAARSLYERAAA
jgi:DNA-binding response OmpR family regulator